MKWNALNFRECFFEQTAIPIKLSQSYKYLQLCYHLSPWISFLVFWVQPNQASNQCDTNPTEALVNVKFKTCCICLADNRSNYAFKTKFLISITENEIFYNLTFTVCSWRDMANCSFTLIHLLWLNDNCQSPFYYVSVAISGHHCIVLLPVKQLKAELCNYFKSFHLKNFLLLLFLLHHYFHI